jgi:hypothetical protein
MRGGLTIGRRGWKQGLSLCEVGETERECILYEYLACELINNEYNSIARHHWSREAGVAASPDAIGHGGLPESGVGIHPYKKEKKLEEWDLMEHLAQEIRCMICKAKMSYVCNGCLQSDPDPRNAK